MKRALLLGSLVALAACVAEASELDLSKPVYLGKDKVICSELQALSAYIDGQQAAGEAEGHRRVADLFVHPRGECLRVWKRERMDVLAKEVAPQRLVDIKWSGFSLKR
jgi:hypothetical protein